MIQCPDCSKDIADDSAHCGFCGAKIVSGGGKKTIMGFAAVTGETLREAAEEARRARLAAEAQAAAPAPQPETPKPFVREPSGSQRTIPGGPGGHFPGSEHNFETPQAGIDAVKLDLSANVADDDAKTEMMSAVGDGPSEADFDMPTDPDPMSAPKTLPTPGLAAKTQPERDVFSGPTELGGGFEPDGPSQMGGPIDVAGQTLPAKKNSNKLIIGAVLAVPVLGVMCCVGWQIVSYVMLLL